MSKLNLLLRVVVQYRVACITVLDHDVGNNNRK